MEQENGSNNEDDKKFREIQDDVSGLVDDIQDREQQRQKSIDMMHEKANASISEDEREMWLSKAKKMEEIHGEFKGQFPELFPDDRAEEN